MSFPRHRRSIIRWVFDRGPGGKRCPASPLPLIGVMSRSRLFLGGSLSSVARLRFAAALSMRYSGPVGRVFRCFAANGNDCLNPLCQPRGQPHIFTSDENGQAS